MCGYEIPRAERMEDIKYCPYCGSKVDNHNYKDRCDDAMKKYIEDMTIKCCKP